MFLYILQLFDFCLQKLLQYEKLDNIKFGLVDVTDIYDKIASEGEGRKPSSDRQKYIAESEFALLGILSEQCLIIYFYLGSSGQH